jgi:hypothetical protein
MGVAVHYRCSFLNLRSEIARVEIIEAATDTEAVARGDTLFREQGAGYISFEVWDRGYRVERNVEDNTRQIMRWRMKAEEIRAASEGFVDGTARNHMRNSADTYDALANSAEKRLLR